MGLLRKKRPKPVKVRGHVLTCVICKSGLFWEREAMLNTSGLTLFGLDWANASGTCYVCSQCGYIHWFLPQD